MHGSRELSAATKRN